MTTGQLEGYVLSESLCYFYALAPSLTKWRSCGSSGTSTADTRKDRCNFVARSRLPCEVCLLTRRKNCCCFGKVSCAPKHYGGHSASAVLDEIQEAAMHEAKVSIHLPIGLVCFVSLTCAIVSNHYAIGASADSGPSVAS